MTTSKSLLCGLAVVLAVPHITAHAEPVVLAPVLVQGVANPRSADELVHPVEVLQGAELDRKPKGTIGELLEGELGISSSDFGPGVGRPLIRGKGGPRVLLLENGISTMDVGGISNDHAVALDPAHAEQVEIIKGPATLLYGSAASAGVINVINGRLPLKPQQGHSGELQLGRAANGEDFMGNAKLSYGGKVGTIYADYAERRSTLFDISSYSNSDRDAEGLDGKIPNSAVQTRSGAAGYSYFGSKAATGIAVSSFDTRYGIPAEESAYIDLKQHRIDNQSIWTAPVNGIESLRLRVGVNRYKHTEFEAPQEPGTRFTNNEEEIRFEARHTPLLSSSGVVGAQWVNRRFAAVGDEAFVPPTHSQELGLFWVEERPFDWGRLEAGLRLGHSRHNPTGNSGFSEQTRTPISVAVGGLVHLGGGTHMRINVGHSQRAVSAEELFSFGPHLATNTFERGDQNLGIEKVNSLEIGIDRHLGHFLFKTTVFYEAVEDYVFQAFVDCNADADSAECNPDGIADSVTGEGVLIAPGTVLADGESSLQLLDYRARSAGFTGAEGELAYKFLIGSHKLTGKVFGDIVRAKLDQGGDLPRTTPPRWGAELQYVHGPLRLASQYTRVTRQNRLAQLESSTAGFNLLSADFSYTLSTTGFSTEFFLHGRNLLDEEARRHTSFLKDVAPIVGRSVQAGVTLQF